MTDSVLYKTIIWVGKNWIPDKKVLFAALVSRLVEDSIFLTLPLVIFVYLDILYSFIIKIGVACTAIAKLSPAQSNSNSDGWAEIALISTFTHPQPQGKYQEGNFNTFIDQI